METFRIFHNRRAHFLPFLWGNVVGFVLVVCAALVALAFTFATPAHKIVRGISVDGIAVSGLTREQAIQKLRVTRPTPEPRLLSVRDGEKLWATDSASLGHTREYEAAVDAALREGKTGPLNHWLARRAWLLASPISLPLPETLDSEAVRAWVDVVARELDEPGQRPQLSWNGSALVIRDGISGRVVQREELAALLMTVPHTAEPLTVPTEVTAGPLSPDARIRAEARAQALSTFSLALHEQEGDQPRIVVGPETFAAWVDLPEGWNDAALQGWLHTISEQFALPARDAAWELADDQRTLTTFVPERAGRQLLTSELQRVLLDALQAQQNQPTPNHRPALLLPLTPLEPTVRLRDLNTMGVQELVGAGDSTFFHSIPNRVYNVALTSERVHGTLVLPGEEFSFSQTVGDISSKSGYKTAYVIRNGRTELGDGGGVCQVSTTVFRAALNAGLPITAWKAHSYRVGYYEQNSKPGFDATIYAPSVDLRFRNDTGHALVVASFVDTKALTLRIELWGTRDGRVSEISNYRIYNQRPAPEALRVPDPTLPSGVVKQIDWAAPGATTKFHYRVTNPDGSVRTERDFVSVFRPWQAVYLYGP